MKLTKPEAIALAKMHIGCRRDTIVAAWGALSMLSAEDFHFLLKCRRHGAMPDDELSARMDAAYQTLMRHYKHTHQLED